VIVGALLGNENAGVQNRAEAVFGFVGQALSAVVMSSAAGGNLNALLGVGTKAESSIAVLFATSSVSR
jgi:hypothetical protein